MSTRHQRTTVLSRMATFSSGLDLRGLQHVPLHEAARAAAALRDASFAFSARPPQQHVQKAPKALPSGHPTAELVHTTLSAKATTSNRDRWDPLLNRLGAKYNVPPLFLKAVMLAESGGDPHAVGDNGHSVGLFQLHDQGYGYGMGDVRFDPEANAERAARGLAEAWHACAAAGHKGEHLVRAAYDYSFNPGGGFAWQGDRVVAYMNELLAESGLPPLA